jgi:hypothetical protein
MTAADSTGRSGSKARTSEDQTTEERAAALAAQFVDNATAATVAWLEGCATAFESSLTRAVAGKYTTSDLAKDAAAQWARNISYAARVFSVGSRGGDTSETTTHA